MAKEEMRDTTQFGDGAEPGDGAPGSAGGQKDAGFVARTGNMGTSHRPAERGDDGTALPQTDPAMTGIDTENPNVNDADAGDSRLVDPGNRNP
jgi:hypothetical protein